MFVFVCLCLFVFVCLFVFEFVIFRTDLLLDIAAEIPQNLLLSTKNKHKQKITKINQNINEKNKQT